MLTASQPARHGCERAYVERRLVENSGTGQCHFINVASLGTAIVRPIFATKFCGIASFKATSRRITPIHGVAAARQCSNYGWMIVREQPFGAAPLAESN